jgi:RNA recognition motif-containing protein
MKKILGIVLASCVFLFSNSVDANDCPKIFIGNLSYNATEQQVYDLFSEFGSVTAVNMINDKDTGRFRGFAFVSVADCQSAQYAVAVLDGKILDDRYLRVNFAVPRGTEPQNNVPASKNAHSSSTERW